MSGTTSLSTLCDPIQVIRLLRAGDRLAHCHPTGWRLVGGDVAVSENAVDALKRGTSRKHGGDSQECSGGRLAPLGDGLFGGFSQTWMWAEGCTAVPR